MNNDWYEIFSSAQASCCLMCLSLTPGESFTRYWRCSATGCTTSSRTTESSCSVTCTVWLLFPRPTRTSCICGTHFIIPTESPVGSLYDVCNKKRIVRWNMFHHLVLMSLTSVLRAQPCGWSQLWGVRKCSHSSPASSMTPRRFCQPSLRSWTEPWSSPWPEPHTSQVALTVDFLKSTVNRGGLLNFCVLFVDFFTGSDSIHGTWCKDILQTIMNFTPHNWASHTLSCFPAPLQVRCSRWGVKRDVRFLLGYL